MSTAFPLPTKWDSKIVRHDFPFMNPYCLLTDKFIVVQVFCSNSQNNLSHNFARHQSETDRPVITRVIFLAFLENQNNIC